MGHTEAAGEQRRHDATRFAAERGAKYWAEFFI
jgi:hypothetical protein